MPNFVYKAVGTDGQILENEIAAPDEQEVIHQLQKLNLVPVRIKAVKSKAVSKSKTNRVRVKEIILFTKQLHTLLRSGVPIIVSLNAIKEQNNNPGFKGLIEAIIAEVEQGNSFSDALAQFPKAFTPMYVSSVKVGEMSGTLEETLQYLYKYLEEEDEIKKNVKKAFRYPIFVVLGIIAAFVVFMVVVIPNFIPIFTSSGMELPLPTRILITLSDVLTHYGFFILVGLTGLIAAAIFYSRTDSGRYIFHRIVLQMPVFGAIVQKVSLSRFAKIFHTMNRTGVSVTKAFETMQDAIDNAVYQRELEKIIHDIQAGEGIANSLRKSPFFSPFIVEMIAIGEKSGALDEMLASVSEYYDLEVRETVGNMTALIEPIVTIILAGMVLMLALALFLPMWNMMSLAQ
ncbi:MAG TPA: type II secretion system F family protein [Caldithrix sp.]|nr:type II secretion system F family protein [Caldithrix sp.]